MFSVLRLSWLPGGMGLGAVALGLLLAACTIWCLLTDPLTMAEAIQSRDATTLASLIAGALASAFESLLRWL